MSSNSRVTVSNNNRRVRLPLRASRLNGTSSRRTLRNLATTGRLRNALGFYDGIFVADEEGNTSDAGIGGVITGLFPNLNWEDWVTNCPLLNIGGNNGGTDDTTGGDGTAEATGDIVIHFETPADTSTTHTKVPYASAATTTAARGTPALAAQRATTSAASRRVGTSASSSRVGATTSYAAAAPASTSVAAANEPAKIINLNTSDATTSAAAGFSSNVTTGATVGNSSSSNVVVPNFSGRRVTQNLVNRRHSSGTHYSGDGIIYPGNHHNHHSHHSGHSGDGYTEVSWEPYTCYEQQVHYEPVTTYETYYTSEPVTKYRKVYTTVEPAYCDDNIITFNDSAVDCGCSGSEWSSHRHHTGYDDGDVWIPEYPHHHRHHSDGTSHHHRHHSGHSSDDVWIPEYPHRHHGHHHSGHSGDVIDCPEHRHHQHHHQHHGHCDCNCNDDTDNGDIVIEFDSSSKKGFESFGDLPSGFNGKTKL
ncbi:hypothetical protein TRICI_000303 [Trichomonascus ciferrii]|uniref:Uncharacterized protein n=1 Tax=Trichomonascus ciferrii TaxID=44093 RepID=A0A642VDR0_9ASCO|nr:hypothetical protein TRICI_000303 [Trichomonascus ciferrii]